VSKYLVPISDEEGKCPYIMTTSARSMEEAECRIMYNLANEWDLDIPADWDDFCDNAYESGYYIGEIRDIEEF
jgi:hypothetical protein